MKGYMTIDNIPVEIHDERNILELIRKIGIELPTFCYYSELSIHGACRMCLVENEKGGLEAACSEPPRVGHKVWTNTARLRKYRKNILELLLSNHNRDCTVCNKSGECRLQDLALKFGIKNIRYLNTAYTPEPDESSASVSIDRSKCILCGDCIRVCNEIQNVGAIDFAFRGSQMKVATAFGVPMASSPCVGCGQCAAVCPTGAISVKNSLEAVWSDLLDKNTDVTVQIAPAVRVAIGKRMGFEEGQNALGLIVAALKRMGFVKVFDTTLGADMTVEEESKEFLKFVEKTHSLPLFTSCCPAWINYAEKRYPELMGNISTCKSPMQMFGALVKQYYKNNGKRHVHVAVMPCTAKKYEAVRPEFTCDGVPIVDHVLSTQELIRMIEQSGYQFNKLEPEAVDNPFGIVTGAGVIFGVSGGVTEAVLRTLTEDSSNATLLQTAMAGERGMEGLKELQVEYKGKTLSIAVVSGLGNVGRLLEDILSGKKVFDFVEVMACPGGCVCGAGQPYVPLSVKEIRGKGLYAIDKLMSYKRSSDNPLIEDIFSGILKGREHELLHVSYDSQEESTE
ncbi:MAG: [FeFe] hydrogenase, group A [Deltaproteobacteria bacterium]|jgi:NADH-quinone oxidoreductase subunit G|nr:[FeFe] hydrogenase, group A [Deltaproteobacteria bacterium]